MPAHVLALTLDLRLPASRSLKDKRATVQTVLDGARRRFAVAAAETDHLDLRQRAELSFAAVSGSPSQAADVIDKVERFVWSFPEVEVLDGERTWSEVA
jgi:uncharacterized protein YlxP (DUF503 family)